MPGDPFQAVAAALVATNPKGQAASLLASLLALTGATGAAFVAGPGQDLDIFAVSGDVPLGELAGIPRARRTRDRESRTMPVEIDGTTRGFLYLRAEQSPASPHVLRLFVVALGECFTASKKPRGEVVHEFLAGQARGEVERAQLVAALTHHDWNVMRAARALAVDRKTIYVWMNRFGLKRPSPPRPGRPPKLPPPRSDR